MRRDIEENTPTTPVTASSPTHREEEVHAESPTPLMDTPRGRAHSMSRKQNNTSSSTEKEKRLSVSEMSSPTELHDKAKRLSLTHSHGHEPDKTSKMSLESSRAERLSRSHLQERSSSEDSSSSPKSTTKKKRKTKKTRVKSTRVNAAFLAKLNGIGAQGGFGISPRKTPHSETPKEDVVVVTQEPVTKVSLFQLYNLGS